MHTLSYEQAVNKCADFSMLKWPKSTNSLESFVRMSDTGTSECLWFPKKKFCNLTILVCLFARCYVSFKKHVENVFRDILCERQRNVLVLSLVDPNYTENCLVIQTTHQLVGFENMLFCTSLCVCVSPRLHVHSMLLVTVCAVKCFKQKLEQK